MLVCSIKGLLGVSSQRTKFSDRKSPAEEARLTWRGRWRLAKLGAKARAEVDDPLVLNSWRGGGGWRVAGEGRK